MERLERAVAGLVQRFSLPADSQTRLAKLAELLCVDPAAPTSVRDVRNVVDRHLADSLVALDVEAIRSARSVVDLGSGAGLPGLPLAIARPDCAFVLLESSRRKCQFIERAAHRCALDNVSVACVRAEAYRERLATFEVAVARALAPLDVVLEYAAPLLLVGGALVVWRGRRDPQAEAAASRAAAQLGMRMATIVQTRPFEGALHHHLHLAFKVVETPSRFPRRSGMAAKRPIGNLRAGRPEPGSPSDRRPR